MIRDVVRRWLDAAMPHRQGPQLGKILSSESGCGEGKYSAKVRILKPGSLGETSRILDGVPLNPIWAGDSGTGVYAPLPVNTLVVIGYLEMDPAHPYVQGVWGEFYNSGDFQLEEFLITNGSISLKIEKNKLHLNGNGNGGLIKINELRDNLEKNSGILQAMLDVINSTPPVYTASPGAISALQAAFKSRLTSKSPGVFTNIENEVVKHGG